ncbi:integrin alpha-V-like [Sardina pilchardus]|uniref:integrin alpha-V-like n=1 Tax=Sardina pilchardus TaxID=27697 RepID=UPI002E15081E
MTMGKVLVCLDIFLVLLFRCSQLNAFNLDMANPSDYSGPADSYFGYSVDFFTPDNQLNLLVGAPKSNSSSGTVVERGAVYSCSWQDKTQCQQIEFDNTGDRRTATGNEFKSHQWFGATVRSDGEHILACAPLYQWSTPKFSDREPVGTCYLKKGGKIVEYSPCRTNSLSPVGQGFCQAGFSADFVKNAKSRVVIGGPGSFYWQGQLISDDVAEVLSRVTNQFITPYGNQLSTAAASPRFDDSYLGYSLAVGDFDNDGHVDYLTGVPRGDKVVGYVTIFNGKNMESEANFTGTQMAAYFGHVVAAADVNNDGHLDIFAGAPLFMSRASDGKFRELGQVSVYLGLAGFSFREPVHLTGTQAYARFGSAIASLGDLDQDGYNDIAISAPYGGTEGKGLVYVYNGRDSGIGSVASQVLHGQWASTSSLSPSFGYSLKGAIDIDKNDYPDLIVGAFGADKAVLYRARPVIITNITLDINPQILNLEDKTCKIPGTTTSTTCFKVKYCLQAKGKGVKLPSSFKVQVDVHLDRHKLSGAKRTMFVSNKASQLTVNITVPNTNQLTCQTKDAFVINDSEFRDKITPVSVFLDYQLDYSSAADSTGLQPVLNQLSPKNASRQAHILLDCGPDNICKPNLQLTVKSDQEQMYIGDESSLTLDVTAENIGEGAYEAELYVYMPAHADFNGVVKKEGQPRLSCAYRLENGTKEVVCDLGNPMKAGTSLSTGLRFSFYQLSDEDTEVKFDLQIHSSNEYNRSSALVSSVTKLAVLARMELSSASEPKQILLPIANWEPKNPPVTEDDIGPSVQHIYALRNNGPSVISKATLDVQWPYRFDNDSLLYITAFEHEGPIQCRTDITVNSLNLTSPVVQTNDTEQEGGDREEARKRTRRDVVDKSDESDSAVAPDELDVNRAITKRVILDCNRATCSHIRCEVGRLERGKSAIVFIKSRLAVATFLKTENQNRSHTIISSASFNVTEMPYKNLVTTLPHNSTTISTTVESAVTGQQLPVPTWIIAVAILAGLLLLILLILIMYKCGFFQRSRPPQEDNEKEQLQPEGEASPEG